jgi:hypothetical protein
LMISYIQIFPNFTHANIYLVPHDRIELPSQDYKSSVMPLY